MFKKWLSEPLIHFLLIGGLLFVIYAWQNDGISDQSKRIVFTKADTNRLVLLWEKKRQRPPTQAELNGMIEQQIREQVMYREALAMGLDQNDSIVRRRLAQKVEFISADLAAQIEPSEKDLAGYLDAHQEMFEIPGTISFVQVYLNADQRGEDLQDNASQLLLELQKLKPTADVTMLGDRFMFGQLHEHLTNHDISRLFGKQFADKILALPVGNWQGPVQSGYGLHFVRIYNKIEARQPELAAVRNKVRNEWMHVQRQTVDKAFYQSLRQQYEIVIEDTRLFDDSLVDANLNDTEQKEITTSAN